MTSVVKTLPANAEDVRDAGPVPGLERSPGGGNGIPLQLLQRASPVAQRAKNLPANAGDVRDTDSVPGSGRSLEEEMASHSSFSSGLPQWLSGQRICLPMQETQETQIQSLSQEDP